MFAGRRRRSSSVKVMQLFHELKQQFPTIPDHIVTSCITSFIQSNPEGKTSNILDLLEAALAEKNPEQMGRPEPQPESPSLVQELEPKKIPNPVDPTSPQHKKPFGEISEKANLDSPSSPRNRFEMNESASDYNRNIIKPSASNCTETVSVSTPRTGQLKRPNYLDIKSETFNNFQNACDDKKKFNIQLSEKCKDVHKLLTSNISDKPPRSPLSAKRLLAKNSPTKLEKSSLVSPDTQRRLQEEFVRSPEAQKRLSQDDYTKKETSPTGVVKKETCSTPSQTTDTLIGSPNVNLSLKVNCSLDVVQSPTQPKHTSVVQCTPTQPWLQTPTSPRSYTSVNLTLRPPTSAPQDPIDITSQNSSLTYSTSSFDSQKGLQSRLQITVGPGGGSVSSVRARPRSYHPQEPLQEVVPARAGSLNDLAVSSEPPVIIKQQARIERLRIELKTEKSKLVIMKQEVADLEKNRLERERATDSEVEKQLLMEIKHLRCQCEHLALADKGDEEFYNNIYTGQRGPLLTTDIPSFRIRQPNRRRLVYQGPPLLPHLDIEGPKWNCGVCTFLNHPDLDKCEQCEMPRIVHGTRNEAVNPNINFDTLSVFRNNNTFDFGQAARSLSLNNVPNDNNNNGAFSLPRPIGFVLDNSRHTTVGLPGHVVSSRSTPNMLDSYLQQNQIVGAHIGNRHK